jgi:exopolysaccharide biosynthesis WecB/TagA/CpsF family protein
VQFRTKGQLIKVNIADASALLDAVRARLTQGAGFALATINLDHLVKLGRDPGFARAYVAQDLVVADGNPIVWLSRLARRPVSLVPGSEMVLPLARLAAQTDKPLVLIGSTSDSLDGAATSLLAQIPGLTIARRIAPPMGFDPEGQAARELLGDIASLGPCLSLLALGAPKQEYLAALGRQIAPQAGFASIGAGLDFLSGHQTRAPAMARPQRTAPDDPALSGLRRHSARPDSQGLCPASQLAPRLPLHLGRNIPRGRDMAYGPGGVKPPSRVDINRAPVTPITPSQRQRPLL